MLWLGTTDAMCGAFGPAQTASNRRDVKLGDQGPDVVFVQYHLSQVGYSLDEDGIFGRETLAAFESFQDCYSYPNAVRGVVNKEAREALVKGGQSG